MQRTSVSHVKSVIRPRPALGAMIVAAACLAGAGPILGQEDRVEAVTLSSGGLAEIRRTIAVEGAREIRFDVPLAQVDDILKSLLVSDPAGGVAFLSLDGPSQVEETFRNLPFSPDTLGSVPDLLASLQGIEVRVTSGGRTVSGRVLGVDYRGQAGGEGDVAPIVSVMSDAGQIEALPLGADAVLEILDDVMLENIRTAAAVSGRGRVESVRTITVALENAGERTIDFDYVVEAPIWKTAYRLILGEDGAARVQAWAIVENASGQDWQGVELTLTSGTPVTLAQRLYQRYWPQRPEIPVLAQTIGPVRPDAFGGAPVVAMADAAFPLAAPAPAPASGASIMRNAESAQVSTATMVAQTAESDTAAIYALPAPIDLAAGQTLSVPFIDAELAAERISIFQPERGEAHPISAIRLVNTTGASLPAGIATVYAPDEEVYAGDAQLDGLPVGESRILSFAADRKVTVTTSQGTAQTAYGATLADGVLRVSSTAIQTVTYSVTGAADGERTIVIEQPRRDGWTLTSEHLSSRTPTHDRLEVALAQGEVAQVVARYERPRVETVALLDADAETLGYWSNAIEDPDVAAALDALLEMRVAIAQIEREVAEFERSIGALIGDQDRIRANLGAVEAGSALAQRYLSMLEEQEDQLAALDEQRRRARQDLDAARDALRAEIASMAI